MKTCSSHIQQEAICHPWWATIFSGWTTSYLSAAVFIHHHGHVWSALVGGVVLHPQQLLDEGMPGVDLEHNLLVEVVSCSGSVTGWSSACYRSIQTWEIIKTLLCSPSRTTWRKWEYRENHLSLSETSALRKWSWESLLRATSEKDQTSPWLLPCEPWLHQYLCQCWSLP